MVRGMAETIDLIYYYVHRTELNKCFTEIGVNWIMKYTYS